VRDDHILVRVAVEDSGPVVGADRTDRDVAFEWQIRVVGRKSTGRPNSSERVKASRIISCASWTDAGSRQGRRAKCA